MAEGSHPHERAGDRPPGRLRPLLVSAGAFGLGFRSAAVGLNVVTAMLLARALSPADFGLYVVGLTIVGFGALIATCGLEKALVRQVASLVACNQAGAARRSVAIAGLFALLGALFSGGVMLAGRNLWFGGSLAGVTWILATWTAFRGFGVLQAAAMRGLHRLVAAGACAGLLRSAILLGLVTALTVTGRVTLLTALAAGAVAAGLRLVFGQALLARRLPSRRDTASAPGARELAAELWRDGWPFLLSSSVNFLTMRADVWLVAVLARAEVSGYYAVATRLVLPMALPLAALSGTVSSTIARLHARGRMKVLEKMLRQGATLALLPAAALAAVLLVGRGRLLGALFGAPYSQAGAVLTILALAHLLRVWAGPCGQTLTMTGHTRQQLATTLAGGGVLLGGSFLAGPAWGMLGVAVAAAGATVVSSTGTLLLARRTLGVWTHAALRPADLRRNLRGTVSLLLSPAASHSRVQDTVSER
jgi:O-antigen/teichoic acid export membrane protein